MTSGAHSLGGVATSDMMDLEELAETVSQRLWLLQLDQLQEVCLGDKIPSRNVTTRQVLIRIITESMDKQLMMKRRALQWIT